MVLCAKECDSDGVSEIRNNDDDDVINVWTVRKEGDDKVFSYEEALQAAGNGRYNVGLLAALCLAIEAMSLDMFGFSVVVTGAVCEFQLTQVQKTILLSVPFLGPILMAYPWGYIADTRGRKSSLIIAMWGSFIATMIGALSPNWEVLAVCKFISTSFSSCLQSVPYTLMGESCCQRVRAKYIIIMASVMMITITIYIGCGYLILNMNFSYDLFFVNFTPWRLLAIVLGVPLGLSAISLYFFHESPKFLANAGYEEEALEKLKSIWKRNGGKNIEFPVKKLIHNEEGTLSLPPVKSVSFHQSLLDQLLPLFKSPLLWRTVQLFYITAAVYFTNSSLFMWFPFLTKEFSAILSNYTFNSQGPQGLCDFIGKSQPQVIVNNKTCSTTIDFEMFIISAIQGFIFTSVNLGISKAASRKKTLMIVLLIFSSFCGVGAVLVKDPLVSVILFMGTLISSLTIGLVFSYFVDLYPTSYRGMAACLSVMVARGGGWLGVNLVGMFVVQHCRHSFYMLAGYLMSAAVVSYFLPSNNKTSKTKL